MRLTWRNLLAGISLAMATDRYAPAISIRVPALLGDIDDRVSAVSILRGAEIVTREDAFHAGFDLLLHACPDALHEIRPG